MIYDMMGLIGLAFAGGFIAVRRLADYALLPISRKIKQHLPRRCYSPPNILVTSARCLTPQYRRCQKCAPRDMAMIIFDLGEMPGGVIFMLPVKCIESTQCVIY